MAGRTSAKAVKVLKTDAASFAAEWRDVCNRRERQGDDIGKSVEKIISQVRTEGDEALLACVKKYDGADLSALEVTREEWDEGCEAVDPVDRAAIGKATMRIREFHRKRIPSSWEMREEGGAYMGQKVRPLARVGLYASGGDVPNPTNVVMNTVPASVVEVPEIIMATPPNADGFVSPELLIAARVAGVHRVFKMGGAHAIAALAYGTESVPGVDKIVGCGDASVEVAKRWVQGDVAVDGESGPSEVVILADRSATPAWIAADLISQAERDEKACSVLITHVKTLATRVQEQITRQLKSLEREDIARESLKNCGAIVVTKNLDESIECANQYAAEHLVLAVDDTETIHKRILNAGTVLLGHYTPVAIGDYLAGPNHVLPTGGAARFDSPLGVDAFLKRTSFMRFEPQKLRELGAEAIRLAGVEGLTGYERAVDLRLQKIRRVRREREAAREAEAEL
jgi:histidinol dehydrogenase